MRAISFILCFWLAAINSFSQNIWDHGRVVVSPNGHYFQHKDGTPFFWLGDTGWQLFARLTKAEAIKYLDNRAAKGYNVIQVGVMLEEDLTAKVRTGGGILIDNDLSQPEESYFSYIDTIFQLAIERNMAIALFCTWGDKVTPTEFGQKIIFDSMNAKTYGAYLGKRYGKYPNVIFVTGGDIPAVKNNISYIPIWRNMALGIIEATNHNCLISYHPNGNRTSSEWLHNEAWLDFNMIQTSHGRHDAPGWVFVAKDRAKIPAKPTLDAEPNYEDHPVNPWPKWNVDSGYFRDYDVRKQLYRSVFAGAPGVTYGHHAIWQFASERDVMINYPDRGWVNAMDRPGATQAGYLRRLIESRPMQQRIPDRSFINSPLSAYNEQRIESFRDSANTYLMVYLPIGDTITISSTFIKSTSVNAWWLNPKDGIVTKIGSRQNKKANEYISPTQGKENDWVLVVEKPLLNYKTPEHF